MSVLIRDVVLEAAALLRGILEAVSLQASFCMFCFALAAICLNLASVSNQVPRPQLCLILLAQLRLCLEVFDSILLEAHELVTFQGYAVNLLHLANEFSVITVVSNRHYYCTIYWILRL